MFSVRALLMISLTVLMSNALCGCSILVNEKVNFDPYEPLRIAVLPFYEVDSDNAIVNSDEVIFQTANLPKDIQDREDPPSAIVHTMVSRGLDSSAFDIIPAGVVTAYLIHNGYSKGYTYDYDKITKADRKALCDLLQCDALLYGKITDWSQTYYGIESVSTVELQLKLVRAADGKVLFESTVEDSDSRGLTKIPTGYTSVVLEPLKGLRSSVIEKVAQTVVDRAIQPLVPKIDLETIEAPSPSLFATTHSAPSGNLKGKRPFIVLATGSPGNTASFSIGEVVRNIPMIEVDKMHYAGEYYPLPTDTFQNEPVKVQISDKYGRVMEQVVRLSNVSLVH